MIRSTSAAATAAEPSPPPPVPILLKYRFPKRYRHPTLDAQLTRQRLTSEARALVRCMKAGVTVPGLRLVDVRQGCLGMEWIEGWSVREILGGGQDDVAEDAEQEDAANESLGSPEEVLRGAGIDEGARALTASKPESTLTSCCAQNRCCGQSVVRLARCTLRTSSTAT